MPYSSCRMQNSAPIKKTVLPKIVVNERSGNQYPSRDTKFESHPPAKSEGAAIQPTFANDAVSFAAIATSTAITPFLQVRPSEILCFFFVIFLTMYIFKYSLFFRVAIII